jgi:hypothetical protein
MHAAYNPASRERSATGFNRNVKSATLLAVLGLLACHALAAAPPAPEAVARELYAYLLEPRRDIGQDAQAQSRWLTASLRELLRAADKAAKAALKCPDAGPDYRPPDNGLFLDAWDAPTGCDVDYTRAEAFHARVGMLCKWGPRTNYPGEQRRMTVMLELERGAWRIADIRSHASKFSRENTLVKSLHALKKESEALSASCAKPAAEK